MDLAGHGPNCHNTKDDCRCLSFDNPRPSYRAENPTNPKIDQNTSPTSKFPLRQGIRRDTLKIPEKYAKNTKIGYSGGGSEGVFRGISRFVCWGILAFRGLSYPVAGRGVVNLSFHISVVTLFFSYSPPPGLIPHRHALSYMSQTFKHVRRFPE